MKKKVKIIKFIDKRVYNTKVNNYKKCKKKREIILEFVPPIIITPHFVFLHPQDYKSNGGRRRRRQGVDIKQQIRAPSLRGIGVRLIEIVKLGQTNPMPFTVARVREGKTIAVHPHQDGRRVVVPVT